MYNVAQDEYGVCLPYDRTVTKLHTIYQFHLCTKTIELPSSKTSIVSTISECFDECSNSNLDYVAVAPQWAKPTYECKCGKMPVSYTPSICGEGTFYGFSNPTSSSSLNSKSNKTKTKEKSKQGKQRGGPQRLGKQYNKQQIEQVKNNNDDQLPNRYHGL
ncbi:uncharacterized protein L201_000321 [Kwoniella dendrophila CBS 6074]|uniref:WSC domain-containing protein n=1 Tax=Kwoniella dendrophila CBS 6074 TaxID=1295534 RepID=A0AAX4JKM0_9TREE